MTEPSKSPPSSMSPEMPPSSFPVSGLLELFVSASGSLFSASLPSPASGLLTGVLRLASLGVLKVMK